MAAQMAGLSPHTIRAWEKRYQALKPARSDNGRRLYTAEEVDRLVLLAQLTHLGSNISQIAGLSDEDLKSMYSKIVQGGELFTTSVLKREVDIADMKRQLVLSVENYEVSTISQLLSLAKNSVEPRVFALDILKPLIDEVSKIFQENRFQNAQVQALFAIIRFHAGNIIYSHFERSLKSSEKFVLAGLEPENHSFNLLITALLCCHHKKNFYYLNTNLPVVSVVEAVKAVEGTTLILSVPNNSPKTLAFIQELNSLIPTKVKVWIVGKEIEGKIKTAATFSEYSKLDELLAITL